MPKNNNQDHQPLKNQKDPQPNVAPGLENDELDKEATPKEVKEGDYTPTTKLFEDRLDD